MLTNMEVLYNFFTITTNVVLIEAITIARRVSDCALLKPGSQRSQGTKIDLNRESDYER
jgi:hypothetical protein